MVELKLGYGEQDREAQKMLAIHQLFSQDPALAPMYGLPQPPRDAEENPRAAGHPECG